MKTKLHKNIMRRIWYAYGIWQVKNQLTSKAFWQGMVFGVSLLIFGQAVHVASVFHNTLDTPLGLVPEYILGAILGAVRNGDLAKVVTLLLLISITISIIKKITFIPKIPHQGQTV